MFAPLAATEALADVPEGLVPLAAVGVVLLLESGATVVLVHTSWPVGPMMGKKTSCSR